MPIPGRHHAGFSVVMAILVMILAGCTGQPKTSTPSPSPAAPTSAAPTTKPAVVATGPLTGDELVWLDGIAALHKTMDNVLNSAPQPITTDSMRPLAQQLASCTAALDRLGPPTQRMQPVYDLAKQGCAQYEKAAGCFTTAADLGTVVAGSADAQKQKQAEDCAFAAPGEGSKLLADAEAKGFEIHQAAK
jgi:hypothetical protein